MEAGGAKLGARADELPSSLFFWNSFFAISSFETATSCFPRCRAGRGDFYKRVSTIPTLLLSIRNPPVPIVYSRRLKDLNGSNKPPLIVILYHRLGILSRKTK
jgi:hypothetical protein